jgi:D-alanyl-lipoteichoic acid acyltransferase DltB (MBOAT superfamily)
MLALMTFKYYLLSVVLSFFYTAAGMTKKIPKRHVLFAVNMLIVFLVFTVSKKHYIFLLAHVATCFIFCNWLLKNIQNKWVAVLSLIVSFSPLLFFKYSFPQEVVLLYFPHFKSLLRPATFIGLSFYTFRVTSVIIDILYGRIKEKITFIDLFNFSLFFPCILSGPLDRYSRFLLDLEKSDELNWKQKYDALFRISWGVFKKIIIADILWNFSNDSYNSIELLSLPTWKIIVGQYAYYLMLYFDFSGYTDVAIGISQLFGIHTPENFNSPWKARNIQIFWNSWHMSFMNWLKDYIFFPLQAFFIRTGISNIPLNNSLSYLAVFIFAGLWHGEESHFFHYGLFHGIGFMIYFTYKRLLEKYLSKEQRKEYMKNSFIKAASILITFHFFLISLFFFIDKQVFFPILLKRIFHGD